MLGETLNVVASDSKEPRDASVDVGARLHEARKARNLELRDIAQTTKISVGALEAIEQNDFGALPGGIFTRAFVRAYSKEVGLDPEDTTRDFMAQAPVEAAQDPARPFENDDLPTARQVVETVFKLLLVGVPIAGLLFLGVRGLRSAYPGAEDAGSPVDAVPPPVSAPLPPPVEAGAAPASPPLAIVLRPRGESWVSLTVDGDVEVSRIMQAGEEASYEAEDEITLNVGNAGQFDFTINGENGRSLGGPGEVVTARITPENYRSYLDP